MKKLFLIIALSLTSLTFSSEKNEKTPEPAPTLSGTAAPKTIAVSSGTPNASPNVKEVIEGATSSPSTGQTTNPLKFTCSTVKQPNGSVDTIMYLTEKQSTAVGSAQFLVFEKNSVTNELILRKRASKSPKFGLGSVSTVTIEHRRLFALAERLIASSKSKASKAASAEAESPAMRAYFVFEDETISEMGDDDLLDYE